MILTIDEYHDWYKEIVYYLRNFSYPNHLEKHQRISLRLKHAKYVLTQYVLGWRSPNGIILRCVSNEESLKLIEEFHSRFWGGHFAPRVTVHKFFRGGYYWPSIFNDVHKFVKYSNHVNSSWENLSFLPFLFNQW